MMLLKCQERSRYSANAKDSAKRKRKICQATTTTTMSSFSNTGRCMERQTANSVSDSKHFGRVKSLRQCIGVLKTSVTGQGFNTMQAVDARSSALNRTMIVSKRGRRPGLPEVGVTTNNNNENSLPDNIPASDIKLPSSARIVPRNHYRRETVTFEGDQCEGLTQAQIPQSTTTTSLSRHAISPQPTTPADATLSQALYTQARKLVAELDSQTNSSDQQKYSEIKTKMLRLIESTQKEWDAYLAKQEKERLMKSQICELKLSVANQTSQKAEMFCKICEECGIDFERVIRKESNAIHRLKAHALNDGGRCIESPENDAEVARLTREKELLVDEVRSLETNYSNLFKLYEKIRENCTQLRTSEEQTRVELNEQNKKYNSLYVLYNDLLNDAQQKLNEADLEMKRAEKNHAEKTLGIRLALKKQKIEIASLEIALKSKTTENEELNKICDALLSKRENAMAESDESAR